MPYGLAGRAADPISGDTRRARAADFYAVGLIITYTRPIQFGIPCRKTTGASVLPLSMRSFQGVRLYCSHDAVFEERANTASIVPLTPRGPTPPLVDGSEIDRSACRRGECTARACIFAVVPLRALTVPANRRSDRHEPRQTASPSGETISPTAYPSF